MEAAADLVVDAAVGHAAAGERDRIEKVLALRRTPLPEEELEGRGCGKLGRAAEATVQRVDVAQQTLPLPAAAASDRAPTSVGAASSDRCTPATSLRDRPGHVVRLVVERARHRLAGRAGNAGMPCRSTGGK